jgi:hypothetical protein
MLSDEHLKACIICHLDAKVILAISLIHSIIHA